MYVSFFISIHIINFINILRHDAATRFKYVFYNIAINILK